MWPWLGGSSAGARAPSARAEEDDLTPVPRQSRAEDQDTPTVLETGQLSWRCWCYPSLKR